MASIAEMNVRLGLRIEQMQKGLRKAERDLRRSARKLKSLGDDLTTAVSLPLLGIGIAGGKMSKDLQSSFSKIENLVGVSSSNIRKYKEELGGISNVVGKSQTELSEALFTITSAGQKGADALDTLTSSGKGSVIGLGETKTVAKATTAIMTAYGKENINASKAVNLLAKTVREGNLEAEELAPSIGKVLPIAAQMGISFEEVGANIATFTRLGISASESVNALKAVLSNLIKPSKKAEETLEAYGLSAQDVRDKIAKNGLAATMQGLIKLFDGNIDKISAVFGSVEGLANVLGTAGAQGEEYARILESMNDGLDIVESGFQKASETAEQKFNKSLVRLQNIAIQVGNVVIPIVTQIADVVADWADRFSNLNSSTQKTIVTVAAFVAGIGPAIKVVGIYKNTLANVKAAKVLLLDNFKKMSAAILVQVGNFQKLNLVMKASVIGLVVGAVAAAVAIFKKFNSKISETQKLKNTLNAVTVTAQQNIVEEKLEVERLVGVLKNETSTREQKKAAMMQLQQLSPQYFGSLDTEKSKIEDVVTAMDSYIANLTKMAKVQAAKERIIELNKELLDTESILDKTEPSWDNYEATIVRMTKVGQSRNEALAKIWGNAANEYKAGLQSQIDELMKIAAQEEVINTKRAKSNNITAPIFTPNATGGGGGGETQQKKREKIEVLDISSLGEQKAAQEDLYTALTKNLTNAQVFQNRLNQEQEASKQRLQEFLGTVATSPEHLEVMKQGLAALNEEMKQMEEHEMRFKSMMEAANTASSALQDYAKQGGDSLRELGQVALKSAADFVRAEMMKAVSSYIAKALAQFGPLGLIAAGAGGAIVGALFNKAIGSLSVPALAQGGLATAPTLAMVGDNPNASVDPEVIAPLSKLKKMMGNMGGGNVHVTGTFKVAGQDLLLILDKASQQRMRTSGF